LVAKRDEVILLFWAW